MRRRRRTGPPTRSPGCARRWRSRPAPTSSRRSSTTERGRPGPPGPRCARASVSRRSWPSGRRRRSGPARGSTCSSPVRRPATRRDRPRSPSRTSRSCARRVLRPRAAAAPARRSRGSRSTCGSASARPSTSRRPRASRASFACCRARPATAATSPRASASTAACERRASANRPPAAPERSRWAQGGRLPGNHETARFPDPAVHLRAARRGPRDRERRRRAEGDLDRPAHAEDRRPPDDPWEGLPRGQGPQHRDLQGDRHPRRVRQGADRDEDEDRRQGPREASLLPEGPQRPVGRDALPDPRARQAPEPVVHPGRQVADDRAGSRGAGRRRQDARRRDLLAGRRPGARSGRAGRQPADCDNDGSLDAVDPDDDNDLLPDTVERQIHTLTCGSDSDGDGMEDGWEYKSALDLNQRSCPSADDYPVPCAAAMPYPGMRPYPNALDATDRDTDYDGDSMTAGEEFDAWRLKATKDASWHTLTDLWYSDGLQASQDTSAAPGCRGMAVPAPFDGNGVRPEFARGTAPVSSPDVTRPEYAIYTLDRLGRHAGDGCLDDAERDEDGDFLSNWEETVGPFGPGTLGRDWWKGVYSEPDFKLASSGTEWLDADVHGDHVAGGPADQDHHALLHV